MRGSDIEVGEFYEHKNGCRVRVVRDLGHGVWEVSDGVHRGGGWSRAVPQSMIVGSRDLLCLWSEREAVKAKAREKDDACAERFKAIRDRRAALLAKIQALGLDMSSEPHFAVDVSEDVRMPLDVAEALVELAGLANSAWPVDA